MMFKCESCGHLFEEGEQAVWEERHGLDTPPYEKWSGCPLCYGAYEKAEPCKICGSNTEEELVGGVCEDCFDECKHDVDICYKIGENCLEEIEINSFLATIFSVSQIEEILLKEIRKAHEIISVDCSEFIEKDKSWFGEMLFKEVK